MHRYISIVALMISVSGGVAAQPAGDLPEQGEAPGRSLARSGFPQEAPPATESAKLDWNLESMLARAVRANPDVLLAEAKVRQAEAELNQVRLKVTQEVMELLGERKALSRRTANAHEFLDQAEKLAASGNVPASDVQKAQLAVLDAQASLSNIEARARYVCGAFPGAPAPGETGPTDPRADGRSGWPGNASTAFPAEVAAKLEKRITLSRQDNSIDELLNALRVQSGLNILLDRRLDEDGRFLPEHPNNLRRKRPIPIPLSGELPVRHWMEAFADVAELVFVVREYGLLLTTREHAATIDGPTIPARRPSQTR